jgi:hypothetical protein
MQPNRSVEGSSCYRSRALPCYPGLTAARVSNIALIEEPGDTRTLFRRDVSIFIVTNRGNHGGVCAPFMIKSTVI